MSFLESVGSFYMLILIFLLVIGFGLVGLALVRFISEPKASKTDKRQNNAYEKNGGFKFMNSWLRLALFSFVAILISMAVLSFVSPGGLMGTNAINSNMYYGNMPMNTPYSNMQVQSGMPMNQSSGGMGMTNMPMGNTQMQSGMPMNQGAGGMGMMSMPMGNTQMQSTPMNQGTGNMKTNNMPAYNTQIDNNSMMQMLNQMQLQLNQMQQQIQQMNMSGGSGGAAMPSGGAAMPAGGGMGMM